ncbi:1,5-anhydro-D-fructose reductase [Culicoides brevitarsis]|uniref:1,5-anhydro-D-fructose reductase n=1 Tax=Culicoides brevitarsis TaxID=469753 RepID=UPI00307C3F18
MNYLTTENGFKMPVLGIGTWRAPDSEVESALNEALEAGYRHIDCAPVYMNEPVIGKTLKSWFDSGRLTREELFITTKLPPHANRASSVEKFLRNSLAALQLDYVDLYLIHVPFAMPETDGAFLVGDDGNLLLDTETSHLKTWKAMEEMVEKGLTKHIGLSNFNEKQIQRIIDNCTIKPANLQIEMHLYLQQRELLKFCYENDITVTAYSPLGSAGIEKLYQGTGIEKIPPKLMENPQVVKIAEKYGKTPAQVLLRFLVQNNVAPIPKSTNPQRLRENLDVFDFALTDKEMGTLREEDRNIRVCDFKFFPGLDKHPEFPF